MEVGGCARRWREEGQIDGCVHSRGWRMNRGMRGVSRLVAKVAPRLLRSRRTNMEHRGQRILC